MSRTKPADEDGGPTCSGLGSDEARLVSKYVGSNLGLSRHWQLALVPVSVSISSSRRMTMECYLLLTNRRVILIKGRTRLYRATVNRSISLLDLDSVQCCLESAIITLSFTTAKELEVWSTQCGSVPVMESLSEAIYDSLRTFQRARGLPHPTGIVLNRKPNSPTVAESVCALYLAICDKLGVLPVNAFYESIRTARSSELNIISYFMSDSSMVRIKSIDLKAISQCLLNQDIFTHVVLPDNLTLPDESVEAIASIVFSPGTTIDSLICHGNNWGRSGIKVISDAMQSAVTFPHLKHLILRNQTLGDEGFDYLMHCINLSKIELKSLTVSNCSISSKGAANLSDSQILLSHLSTLDLSKNDLSRQFATSLCNFLRNTSALRRLSLSMTGIDVNPVLTAVYENTDMYMQRLQVINLSGLKISKEGALILGSMLGQSSTLSHLILERTKISEFLLASIFDAIAKNVALQFVLSFGYCNLGPSFVKIAEDSIRKHGPLDNICVLGIQYNHIGGNDSFQSLCQILQKFSNLKHLAMDGNVEIPRLLNHTKKSKQIGESVATLLQELPKLECLSLAADDQHAMCDGVINVLDAATVHPSLKCIDISANRLSDKGFVAVASLIAQSKTIVRIDMDSNSIPTACLNDLSMALSSNPESKLRFLNIERTLRELATQGRLSRRITLIARLVCSLLDRIHAGDCDDFLPASSQETFAVIRRLEDVFGGIRETFDLASHLAGLVQSFPVDLLQPPIAGKKKLKSISSITQIYSEIDALETESGGYDSGIPQFGISLDSMDLLKSEDIVRWYPAGVPSVLVQMDIYLDAHNATSSVGIFRLAPNEHDSKIVKRQLNVGTFQECEDINSVANNMKVWYREMPVKLLEGIPLDDLKTFTTMDRAEAFIKEISEPYRSLFLWTVDVFAKYSLSSEESKMTPHNLAIVFSPNFIPADTESPDPMADMKAFQLICNIVKNAIEYRLKTYDVSSLKAVQKEWQLRYAPEEDKSCIGEDDTSSIESIPVPKQTSDSFGSSPFELKPSNTNLSVTAPSQNVTGLKPSSISDMSVNMLAKVMSGGQLSKAEQLSKRRSMFISSGFQSIRKETGARRSESGLNTIPIDIQKSIMREVQEAHKRRCAAADSSTSTQ